MTEEPGRQGPQSGDVERAHHERSGRGEDAEQTAERSTTPASPTTPPSPTRSRLIAFATMGVASLVGLILSSQGWWSYAASETITLTGNEATGSLAGLVSGAALAGVALALLLRVFGRRILSVALALLGAAMVLIGIPRQAPEPTAHPQKFQLVLDLAHLAPGRPTGAGWAYSICGLVLLIGAVLMLVRAGGWPRPVDRFTRRQEHAASTLAEDDPHEVWRALDAGHDPTDPTDTDAAGDSNGRNREE